MPAAVAWTVALLALAWLAPREALAQSSVNFRGANPFPGTVRDRLREDMAKTSAQLYGAVGTLERRILPAMSSRSFIAISEMNIIMGGLRPPGQCEYGCPYWPNSDDKASYGLIPVDTYALSVGFGVKATDKLGVFASAGFVYNRAAAGTEAAVGRTLFPMIAALSMPLSHLALASAPFLTGPVQLAGKDVAGLASYVVGASYDVMDTTLYAGMVGTASGAGLYTNITENRVRALVSAAVTDKFEELSYLKFGFDKLRKGNPLTGLLRGDAAENPVTAPTTSLFGRRMNFAIPRRDAAGESLSPGRVGFWTAHFEQYNLLPWASFTAAIGLTPSLVVHELRGSLHTAGFNDTGDKKSGSGVGISAGMVQLPALYMLAQQPGPRFSLRLEGRLGTLFRFAVYRNEPEVLAPFPYAYDAWAINTSVDVGALYGGKDD
jgi:hypothetical protein